MPRMTQQEVDAFNARRKQPTREQCEQVLDAVFTPLEGCYKESDLHEQIFSECRRRGWIALHGAMSERTHRNPGEWDYTILTDLPAFVHTECKCCVNHRILFVELKTRTGKLSPAQAALHHHAKKLGHAVHVVRSFEEFLKLL